MIEEVFKMTKSQIIFALLDLERELEGIRKGFENDSFEENDVEEMAKIIEKIENILYAE